MGGLHQRRYYCLLETPPSSVMEQHEGEEHGLEGEEEGEEEEGEEERR